MTTFLPVLALVFGVFLISFFLINIRYVVKKEEFRGTCATNNPMLKNQIGECTVCGRENPDEECKLPEIKPA